MPEIFPRSNPTKVTLTTTTVGFADFDPTLADIPTCPGHLGTAGKVSSCAPTTDTSTDTTPGIVNCDSELFFDAMEYLYETMDVPGTIDICVMEPPEGLQQVPDITVDTGAGASVASKAHFPFCEVEPSPLKGQSYSTASGTLMPNQGQMRPVLLMETGGLGKFTFQNTDMVKKPLLVMSDINKKDNIGFFDGERSYIITGSPADKKALRELVAKIKAKIPLHLQNSTFKLRTWQPEPPFGRPGR